ncbi:MAG: insulinase family protein [Planctomycetaceae bacterium]|jgi:Zn-dependent M16 (insulinase) family peptidase|nr:insulinase family protein [Planctomycetaceae bacterium]
MKGKKMFCRIFVILIFSLTFVTISIEAAPTEIGGITHGFKLVSVETINELNSTALKFEHVKSGASLLYLSNDDDNKVFAITFRTPPTDDSGIAHVMEHSALCGSKKFRTKEPFMNLRKSSLQTFLNAYTADDCTAYPVASRNDKDLVNLMNVYMDAVLFPRVLELPEILMQEGWHYEIDPKTEELSYNGIVYNEMKGTYSSPQRYLYRKIQQSMYTDSTYGYDSGGDPDSIPELTVEKFRAFHQKFYHPSNAMIFLYGNGDIKKHLHFLDTEYLNQFDRKTIDVEITTPKTFDQPKSFEFEYSVNSTEPTDGKTFLSLNYLLPVDLQNVQRQFGMDLLAYILVQSEAAPLKRALLDAGVGREISASFDSSLKQPCFSIIVKNSDRNKKEQFEKIVDQTLRELVEQGIDQKLISGAVNRHEFQLREFSGSHFSKGISINMQLHKNWVHHLDPLLDQRFEPIFKKIREDSTNGYFEKLIQQYLLDNHSRGSVTLIPKQGLEKENTEKLKIKLAEIKKSLSAAELDEIKKKQQILVKRQSAPDAPEDVAAIPRLSLSDLKAKPEEILFTKKIVGDTPVINIDTDTNKIVYVAVYFDAMQLPSVAAPYTTLISDLLGRLDTKKYTYADLNSEIDIHTGGIATNVTTYPIEGKSGEFAAAFSIRIKTLLPEIDKGLDLTSEILGTQFKNVERIKEIVRERRIALEQRFSTSGHRLGQVRAASYFSPIDAYKDRTSGIGYYQFLREFEKKLEADPPKMLHFLELTAGKLFGKCGNRLITVTSPHNDFVATEPAIKKFESQIKKDTDTNTSAKTFKTNSQLNEAIIVPTRVQYVVRAADYQKAGIAYSGKLLVLTDVLRNGYIWDNIRILGGAYGGGFAVERGGVCSFWSYRDPNLGKTISVFDSTADYLKTLDLSETELSDAIIATIGGIDKPLTPPQKAERVAAMFYSGITQETLQCEWKEVLATTTDDLRKFAPMFKNITDQNNLCVFGNNETLNSNKNLFKTILHIMEIGTKK